MNLIIFLNLLLKYCQPQAFRTCSPESDRHGPVRLRGREREAAPLARAAPGSRARHGPARAPRRRPLPQPPASEALGSPRTGPRRAAESAGAAPWPPAFGFAFPSPAPRLRQLRTGITQPLTRSLLASPFTSLSSLPQRAHLIESLLSAAGGR
ncbi:translation initiation factor IF-2-like isoform X2 [Grus americana]|uniref:translation initiation factor IF-2-like isoform X2 n=1 Tax=Grus americana TaxID=9117 RepID=UPI002407F8F5|nr:translation initiation factor IF-2-like isoform X2 [Grus americana]